MSFQDLNTASHLLERRTLQSVSADELRRGAEILSIRRQRRVARRRERRHALRSLLTLRRPNWSRPPAEHGPIPNPRQLERAPWR